MTETVILAAVGWGLAALLPSPGPDRRRWFGLLFFSAYAITALWLHVASVHLKIPVPVASWAIAGLAIVGLVRTAVRLRRGVSDRTILAHPILVFPGLALLVGLANYPEAYLPLAWDEYSNWLAWARHIHRTGEFWSASMQSATPGYLPGYPLLMAFPNALIGEFREVHSAPLQFLIHVGVLGQLFDLLAAETDKRLSTTRKESAEIAWKIVLAILLLEPTWKLMPPTQLIEKPQIYAFSAVVLICLRARGEHDSPVMLAAHAGIALAFAFALKMAALVFLPTAIALYLLIAPFRGWRPLLRDPKIAAMFLPILLLGIGWFIARPEVAGPFANPFDLVSWLIWQPSEVLQNFRYAGRDVFGSVGMYLLEFKPAISLAAIAGFVYCIGLRRREGALIGAGLAIFFVATVVLIAAYHARYVNYHQVEFDRFVRVALRPIHLFGLILPILIFLGRHPEMARRWLVPSDLPRRSLGLLTLIVLFGVQIFQTWSSMQQMSTRSGQDARLVAEAEGARKLAPIILNQLRQSGEKIPTVTVIDQESQGNIANMLRYYAIGETPGDPPIRFIVDPQFYWAPARVSSWANATSGTELAARLKKSDILIAWRLDDFVTPVLMSMSEDPRCVETPEGRLWIRFGSGERPFTCSEY